MPDLTSPVHAVTTPIVMTNLTDHNKKERFGKSSLSALRRPLCAAPPSMLIFDEQARASGRLHGDRAIGLNIRGDKPRFVDRVDYRVHPSIRTLEQKQRGRARVDHQAQ